MQSMVHENADTTQSIGDNGNFPEDRLKTIYDIIAILYEVRDFNAILEMILDTCSEYLQLYSVGIMHSDDQEQFRILRERNLPESLKQSMTFSAMEVSGNQYDCEDDFICLPIREGGIQLEKRRILTPDINERIVLLPICFQERTLAYFLLPDYDVERASHAGSGDVLQIFAKAIAPLFYIFKDKGKRENNFENIISKIIKDRMHEAKLVLSPISFAIFRIQFVNSFQDVFMLNEAVRAYQNAFTKVLTDEINVLWLTLDTAFFIFPNTDILKAETLCKSLKETIEHMENYRDVFKPQYVCTGYPQAGNTSWEIINSLWLNLINENSLKD